MRYVVKVERLVGGGDMDLGKAQTPEASRQSLDLYLASKRMTEVPHCEGIDNPDIMIWKTREAAEKYLERHFSWQQYYLLEYQIKERE